MSITHRNIKRLALALFCSSLFPGLGLASASAEAMGSSASLRSMARIHMASGRYGKAQPLLEKALHMAQETHAPESEACACMLDLAYLYKNQDRLTEAETMCRSGLALQQKTYPQNHPYMAHTLRILSDIYRRQARYQEAASALERAITIVRDVSRGDDQELAPFKVDMARLLVAQGDFIHADSYYKAAIDIIEASYGPKHFYTAKVLASMAELYVLQERYTEAEALISRTLPIQERVYGPDHYLLVPVWLIASRIHQAKEDMANARLFLDKSLVAVENHAGPGDPFESDVLIRLGEWYLLGKQYDQAEDTFRKVLQTLEGTESPHSDRIATALNNLAKVYIGQGKYAEAQPLCQRALVMLESVYDPDHPGVADVLETLAQLHLQTGDTAEATKLKQRVHEIHMHQRVVDVPVVTAME